MTQLKYSYCIIFKKLFKICLVYFPCFFYQVKISKSLYFLLFYLMQKQNLRA